MYGEIELKSELGRGTKATFWILFNKPQLRGAIKPLADLRIVPARVQHGSSLTECESARLSISVNPLQTLSVASNNPSSMTAQHSMGPLTTVESALDEPNVEEEMSPQEVGRKKIHVLVVEDK